jgi:acetyl-CoA dehydrogenase-like protein
MKSAIHEWQDSVAKLLQTLNSIRQVGEELGPRQAVLRATDVCMFFGDAMCAYYLLKMGLLAEKKLAPLTNGMDPRAAALQNPEARFYFNKIKTAEHYVFDILPRGKAVAAKVQARNFAALDAVLEM